MMNNVKNILFAAFFLAPAQNIFAASYLPAFIKNTFRRNEVCVSPELTFAEQNPDPLMITIHNVKVFNRDSDVNIISNISTLEFKTIKNLEELKKLVDTLKKRPDGKLFTISAYAGFVDQHGNPLYL